MALRPREGSVGDVAFLDCATYHLSCEQSERMCPVQDPRFKHSYNSLKNIYKLEK
jgi:hypothetical protein